ncbi:hypothetical protein E3U55_15375 [Filobacillus milosensis]|uniref:Uncharacterized protein n=1 Tax=Filobacillus milosensis TaxID=94137 RepID=A0A4Y8IG54_9BACI|nr:hypothetical protein [Filobacillus milosensis]TFB13783.1 hypothetical protein E3U55_15375 [Filobacillus milosensis]
MSESIYFNDNFFSAGQTDIFNEEQEKIGYLDLKSAFSSGVEIGDVDGTRKLKGYFPFISGKWNIDDAEESNIGILRSRFSFFTKVYEYTSKDGEVYKIESEAFSKEYTIMNQNGDLVCDFKKVNNFFESAAFQLTDYTDKISTYEWVAVVMGVNAIQKRRRNSSAGGAT